MKWTKLCCGALAGELIILSVMPTDKPDIGLPPNYNEPHPYEWPFNHVPQWGNEVVAVAGTANTAAYSPNLNVF